MRAEPPTPRSVSAEGSTAAPPGSSYLFGGALADEPGLGTLTLPGYLRELAQRFGPREALVLRRPGSTLRWTYSDLWARSLELSRALLAAGIGKHSRVGILMTNRPEFLSGVFATGLAGAVAVPLSTFSTPPELEYLLRTSCVSLLLLEPEVLSANFLEILESLAPEIRSARPGELLSPRLPFLRRIVRIGEAPGSGAVEPWSEFLARGASLPEAISEGTAASVKPSDPALLFFSSGTTDQPKGIVNSHRGIAIQLWRWRRLYDDLDPDVRCWQANGLFWSGAFSMGVGVTFSHGGSLVLQPTFSPAEALELMAAERVNLPLCWPHQWARLTEATNWSKVDLSGLRHVDRDSPLAQHPSVRTEWIEPKAYGVTETFTIVTGYPATSPAEEIRGSFGPPLPGNTLKIVDPLTGEIVPRGRRGEIAVKGPTLMLGYAGVPLDETLDAEGFFHTGDGGYLDETGMLFWEGRLTDVIKTGGANVSPREVDAALAGHPDIRVAQTVGVPHPTLGELVVSCVVPHEGAAPDEAALRAFLRERLASYKVPRRILMFRDEELALTGSAKVKASELRELAIRRLDGGSGA